MRSKTVCFTGHRELPADDLPEISKHLEDTLATLIEQGYRYFGAGGALGFDKSASRSLDRGQQPEHEPVVIPDIRERPPAR